MTDAGTGPTPGPGPSGQWAQRSEREPPGGCPYVVCQAAVGSFVAGWGV